ncbi:hypothetical protein D3C86_1497650 [compost metagenome]
MKRQPAATAPRAIASFPIMNNFCCPSAGSSWKSAIGPPASSSTDSAPLRTASMFFSTTAAPLRPNSSSTALLNTSSGRPSRAHDAPDAAMFLNRDVPSSSAIAVIGTGNNLALIPSGKTGLNLASATMTPLSRSSCALKSILSWSNATRISKSSEIARIGLVLMRILLFVCPPLIREEK